MATHSSIIAWENSWTEEPGGLQFVEMQESTKLPPHLFLLKYKNVLPNSYENL